MSLKQKTKIMENVGKKEPKHNNKQTTTNKQTKNTKQTNNQSIFNK